MEPARIATIVFLVLLFALAGLLVYLGVKKDRREKNTEKTEKLGDIANQEAAQKWLINEYYDLFEQTFLEIKKCHNKTSSTKMTEINKKALDKILILEGQEDFKIVQKYKNSKIDFDFITKLKKYNASSWKSKFPKEIDKFIKLQKENN